MEGRQGELVVRLLAARLAAALFAEGPLAGRSLARRILAAPLPTAAQVPEALLVGALIVMQAIVCPAGLAAQTAGSRETQGIPVPPVVEGPASGTLTLNGARFALTHAYASARPGAFDKQSEDTRVLLTDAALSDEAREDVFDLMALARADKVHAVELLIDASGSVISGAFYAKAFEGTVSATGMHRFERERRETRFISGRLWMESPSTFMKVTFHYDVRFSAPIPRPATAEETAAALASPPARAAAAHLAAIRQGKLAALIATLTPEAAADYQGAAGDARLQQLRADMPPDTRVSTLAAATAPDDGAFLVTVEGHQDGVVIAYVLKLRALNGVWKVDK